MVYVSGIAFSEMPHTSFFLLQQQSQAEIGSSLHFTPQSEQLMLSDWLKGVLIVIRSEPDFSDEEVD